MVPSPVAPSASAAPEADVAFDVLLFASIRDAVGAPRVTARVPAGATARDLLDALGRAHPAIARQRRALAVAVDHAIVGPTHVLRAGAEVALLPPVGGG